MVKKYFVTPTIYCALVLLPAVFFPPAYAADLLLFPSITSAYQTKEDAELGSKKFVPAVDVFYTNEFGQTRFLAEFLKSSREAELERLQLGWRIMPGKTLWVGRFHNALSFWNTQMHHGDFMQSSLSRPTVANYEDEHGPLPAHLSGLLFESSRTVGDSETNYTVGLGVGPTYNDVLQPLDLLNPAHPGKLAASFRFGFHPEAANPNQFGIAIGYAKIPIRNALADPVSNILVDEIRQSVFSTFLNFEENNFHLIGELFIFDDSVSGFGAAAKYTSLSAYIQPEYKIGENGRTTLYARIESTPQAGNDGYLSLLPEFSPHQGIAGLRYDISSKQAIKFEVGRTSRQDGLQFNSISAQWSMGLPL